MPHEPHSPPRHSPALRRILGEATTPLDGLRLLPQLPRQLRPRTIDEPRDVLVLPGFLASNASTVILRRVLRRDGHRVRGWEAGRNDGNVGRLVGEVERQLQEVASAANRPVDLVAWSLGGVVARELGRRHPTLVRRIVTLSTPLYGPSFTSFSAMYGDERLDERAARARATPPRVPITVVWTRRDGVVHWRAQQDHDNPWAEHVEVRCTHLGMTLDPEVLDVVRDRVASDTGQTGLRVSETRVSR